MASDDAYAAFLEKANQDPSEGYSKPAAADKASAGASGSYQDVPDVLVAATRDMFYTSDTDEPFEALAIPSTTDNLPDEDTFIQLTKVSAAPDKITILDPYDWDAQGRYKTLLDAVREAGQGNDVRVYRVQLSGATRVEYWLVAIEGKAAAESKKKPTYRLVGVKAKSVES